MVYNVAVVEMLRKIVSVEADSEREAHRRVSDAWANGEIVLTPDDFEGVEFFVGAEGRADCKIERKG